MTKIEGTNPANAAAPLPHALRKPRLTRPEAAEYLLLRHGLRVAATTLAKKASTGGGPSFNRTTFGVFYPVSELDAWAEKTLGEPVRSTSEAASPA